MRYQNEIEPEVCKVFGPMPPEFYEEPSMNIDEIKRIMTLDPIMCDVEFVKTDEPTYTHHVTHDLLKEKLSLLRAAEPVIVDNDEMMAEACLEEIEKLRASKLRADEKIEYFSHRYRMLRTIIDTRKDLEDYVEKFPK